MEYEKHLLIIEGMDDFNVLNKSLQDFAIAYQSLVGIDDQRSIQGLMTNEQNPAEESKSNVPISIPHLALQILQTYRSLKNEVGEDLSEVDSSIFEALEEVVDSFPKWTSQFFGKSIRIKFLEFLEAQELELPVAEKNKIYGGLGNIAFSAFLIEANHEHQLLKELSLNITKSSLLDRIDLIRKLMRYYKEDLSHISNITVYISDVNPLSLPSDYINKSKLVDDFNKIQGYVDFIKGNTDWGNIKSKSFLSDLLQFATYFASKVKYSEAFLKQIAETLLGFGVNKTQGYVFLNDTLYPFIDGLKSEDEILISISKNEDVPTVANINRRKKRAVENLLNKKI